MGITVRELITKLTISGDAGAKLAKFGLAVNGVKAGLEIMLGAVKAVSAATVGLVIDITATGDAIAKTARSVGTTAEEFQRLSFAAERSGVPMTNLVKGLQNIQRNMRDAALAAGKGQGTGFTAALGEVGLRLKDLAGLNAEDQIGLIGEALGQVEDAGRRVALSQKLVGEEAGPKFASLLAESRSGIKKLGDEAERLGLVMDKDALDSSEAFQDSLTNMKSVITGLRRVIGVSLIPQIKKGIDSFSAWLLVNRKIVKDRIGKVVGALSKAFSLLLENSGKLFDMFEASISILESMVSALIKATDAVGGLENLIKLAAVAWGTYALAQATALGPIGLMAFALAGLAVAFINIESAADKARIASKKFAESENEDIDITEEAAKKEAQFIASRVGKGLDVFAVTRRVLATTSRVQTALIFQEARKILSFQIAVQRRRDNKTTDPRALEFLNKLIEDTKAQREFESKFRAREDKKAERESEFTDLTTGPAGFRPSVLPTGKDAGGGEKKSLTDLIIAALESGKTPEVASLLASSQPPIVIPITNNNITMEVDAPITVNGVPGEDAESTAERTLDIVKSVLRVEFVDAIDQLRPRLAK